ncbi:hypothetical protein WN943_019833 [Citrus x changshan-huyou]
MTILKNYLKWKVMEYLATTRTLPRLIDVVKGSTKEKVVRVVVLILRNLLPKGNFAAQMIDLRLPQVVQSLKAQAWSDEHGIILFPSTLLIEALAGKCVDYYCTDLHYL